MLQIDNTYQIDEKWLEDNENMVTKELMWVEKARLDIENLKIYRINF